MLNQMEQEAAAADRLVQQFRQRRMDQRLKGQVVDVESNAAPASSTEAAEEQLEDEEADQRDEVVDSDANILSSLYSKLPRANCKLCCELLILELTILVASTQAAKTQNGAAGCNRKRPHQSIACTR